MTADFSPSTVLDSDDLREEILLRYKYQCSAAAINCIRLILDASDVVTVVC